MCQTGNQKMLKQFKSIYYNRLTNARYDVCRRPHSISLTGESLVKDITMKEMTRQTGKRDVTQVRE